jgi:hypothetical protein
VNPSDREQIRLSLLRYLDAAAEGAPGRGIATAVLRQHLRSEGFAITEEATLSALEYLKGKGLVARAVRQVSPENAGWIITSAGRDEYAVAAGGV